MKKYQLILFIMTLLTTLLPAQVSAVITAQLLDSQNQEPLAYVNIGIIGTSIGTVSAPDGTFELHLPEGTNEEQIVRFSYVGYESKDFTLASLHLLGNSTITLKKAAIELQTIEVRPVGETTKTIGHKRTRPQMVTNFSISKKPNQNLGAAIGRKFNLGKERTYLKNFRFFIAANNFDTTRFQVNVFTTKNGKPDQLINTQEIITEINQLQRGWVTVDLSPYSIYAKNRIIVAITWIYHSPKGEYLQLPLTLPAIGATHYYRYGSQNKWKRFIGMSTAMQLEIVQ